ncbi:MAG: Lipolytic protein family [Verrucomicrobiales bacterium]|nr:Lipolytic protein family [Verrucomicrobiales bacterium]
MKVLCLFIATIITTLARLANAADDYQPRVYTNASLQTLPYRLLTPRNYNAAQKYPLVLFFHGAGERGNDNQRQLVHGASLFLKPENRDKFPCFVIAPQCPEKEQWVDMPWSGDAGTRPEKPSKAMKLALEVLQDAGKEFSIDHDRIYVTGLSMGGYATWDLITRFPDRFAAAAPVCGGGDEKTIAEPVAKVPVWAFHSEDDTVVKVIRSRNMIAALQKFGGKPKYFEYFSLGHGSWDKAYSEPELIPWMFAQRLGQPDTFVLKTHAPELPDFAKWPASTNMFPGAGPLQTADWFQERWKHQRLNWWLNQQKDKGAVVFLGDSITEGWNTLAKDFPGIKVANRGIGGDTTRGVRLRMKEDVEDLNPAAVVLLIGTNDLGLGGKPETVAENIKAILASLREHDPRMPVIVCKVMPRQEEFSSRIQRLNELVDAAIKGDPEFIRCDTWSIFANQKGAASASEFPDLLHPNIRGNAKWKAALEPIFAQLNLAHSTGGK